MGYFLFMMTAAIVMASLAAACVGGFAWLLAKLLKWRFPTLDGAIITKVAAAVLPTLLLLNLIYTLSEWSKEADLSGPDVQAIAFAIVVACFTMIAGWFVGLRMANIAARDME